MFVSMHTISEGGGNTVFKLHALRLGDYFVASINYATYDFTVSAEWDAHPACVAILETLSEDNEKPISISLGGERIGLDPVIAGELFDCLLAFTIINEHQ